MANKILLVEDEKNMRFLIAEALGKSNYIVEESDAAEDAIEKMASFSPDMVILDVNLPCMSGLDALSHIKQIEPHLPVVIITANNAKEVALDAINRGAYDFFTKPFKLSEMEVVVKRALEKSRLQQRIQELQHRLDERYKLENIIGQSDRIGEVMDLIKKVSCTDATVLIIGETGTGKELVSEAIHNMSPRKDKSFVRINCAAIPSGLIESELFGHEKGAFTGAVSKKPGKFEIANNGTILLDEIADMPLDAQAKVLRVLQEKVIERVGGNQRIAVDVRVIASTNKSLSQEVKDGKFREDLFYRLNVFPITLPPLRERKEDIPLLTEYFMKKAANRTGAQVTGITEEALNCLKKYDWPGNVRELENVIERALIMSGGDTLTPAHFSIYLLPCRRTEETSSLDCIIGNVERDFIVDALQKACGIQSKAAKLLGITERSLWHRIKKYGIDTSTHHK